MDQGKPSHICTEAESNTTHEAEYIDLNVQGRGHAMIITNRWKSGEKKVSADSSSRSRNLITNKDSNVTGSSVHEPGRKIHWGPKSRPVN